MTKEEARRWALDRRAHRASSEVARQSLQVQRRLLASSLWLRAKSVFVYLSLPGEVQTGGIVAAAWAAEKLVYAPRVGTNGYMEATLMGPETRLERGAFGLLQPPPGPSVNRIDLVLVPGLAFSPKGDRVGFGKGYYDRFLTRSQVAATIGLGFQDQLVMEMDAQVHDVSVDALIMGGTWIRRRTAEDPG